MSLYTLIAFVKFDLDTNEDRSPVESVRTGLKTLNQDQLIQVRNGAWRLAGMADDTLNAKANATDEETNR